jgi:hypothetical protein
MYNEERENEIMERKDEIEEGVALSAICRFFIAGRYAKLCIRVQMVHAARS